MPTQSSTLDADFGDRYRLLRELGRGGAASVWLAEDRRHGREVALKVLHPEVAAMLGTRRFLREIEIAARLSHPNILPLHEAGDAGGLPYYVMPVVHGESLRDRLRREIQLPVDEAIGITIEVAEGLAYAHEQAVVHRDIKPENILLQSGHAVIADFGIAKALATAGGETLTATGLAVGTPAYMSPEQSAGSDHLDPRTDIYSLGCVLFEMLAGEPPFSAPTPQALAAKHMQAPPPKVRLTRKTVPAGVERAIERALAKVPADRYPSAKAFGQALERARSGEQGDDASRRRRVITTLAGVGMALLAVAMGIFWSRREPTVAQLNANRVLVFPLRSIGPGLNGTEGEAVATLVGYALDGSEPLRWLDGWDYLTPLERRSLDSLSTDRANELSRRALARYFVDGSVVRAGDSLAVVLRLHDVLGDSLVARAGASQSAATADPALLGLRAVSQLLPALVAPGQTIDLRPLGDRKPAAIASFLQGEQAYRRMRFDLALPRYNRALAADSQLAVAAVKGAQAAVLLERYGEAHELASKVLAGEDALSRRYRSFAAGILAYLDGRADSAVAAFRRAIATDEASAEAWTALGETFYHLVPSGDYADSSAAQAFLHAEALDSTFSPPLVHLAHIAIRKGDLARASQLIDRLSLAEPEGSEVLQRLRLMFQCVRDGPGSIDWGRAVQDSEMVVPVARMLSIGARQPACAVAAYRAQLADPRGSATRKWGALLGLASLLAAQDRRDELRQLLDSQSVGQVSGQILYFLTAAAGTGNDAVAAAAARRYVTGSSSPDPATAWIVGEWGATKGDTVTLNRMLDSLRAKLESRHYRSDSVRVAALEARRVLMNGDTVRAMELLERLTPSAPPADLEWQPWESFAPERLV
ncbi:MAG TPA: serine/threonine-protein kinase, partial [Gemmatimonadales bacterium]|nr:serine/threonine-protein kinase [Gemmatimonadales bacterium]